MYIIINLSSDLDNIWLLVLLSVTSAEYLYIVGRYQACAALTPGQ